MTNDVIRFPGFNINLHVGQSIKFFGIEVAFYGIVIAFAFFVAAAIVLAEVKKTNKDMELYEDFFVWTILSAILGARLYYVIFEWDYYKKHIDQIVNIRNGGLAIYGGIIAVIIAAFVFCRVKKTNALELIDTCIIGLPIGQAIGRYGNFFNREAFGGYCTNKFRMEIPIVEANGVTSELLEHAKDGFISVHPTFLYESVWNVIGFIILMCFRKRKAFDGQLFAMYMLWYGIGRAIIEGLRTDQLRLGGFAVSQLLSVIIAIAGSIWLVIGYRKKICK